MAASFKKLIHRLILLIFAIFLMTYFLIFYFLPDIRQTSKGNQSCILSAATLGRQGNNMFQYATLYAFARLYNCRAILPSLMKERFQGCFSVSMTSDIALVNSGQWKEHPIAHLKADNRFNMTNVESRLLLTGYPYDWRYFHQFESNIRREFQFVTEIREEANGYLLSLRRKWNRSTATYVGVHIRRTDFIPYLQEYGCITADAKYVATAMRVMKNKYPNSLFVVASDDIEWCKTELSASQFDIAFVTGQWTPCSTMALLSLCNHSIVTQGTFGFWSAYLAGGEAIYLTDYCANKTRDLYQFSALHLSHWSGIPAS